MKAQFVKFQFLADPDLMSNAEYLFIGKSHKNYKKLKIKEELFAVLTIRGEPNNAQLQD